MLFINSLELTQQNLVSLPYHYASQEVEEPDTLSKKLIHKKVNIKVPKVWHGTCPNNLQIVIITLPMKNVVITISPHTFTSCSHFLK